MPTRLFPVIPLLVAQNKCDAGKLKCVRSKFACLIKVYEASQKRFGPSQAR